MAGKSISAPWVMAATARPSLPVLIIEARYYEAVAEALIEGALAELEAQGVAYERLVVPGALEIPQVLAAAVAAGAMPADAAHARYSGAVLLGCVIRGETSHYAQVRRQLLDVVHDGTPGTGPRHPANACASADASALRTGGASAAALVTSLP